MSTIRELLQEKLIIEEIGATDKKGVLREFARLLKAANSIDDEEGLVRVLLEREALGSTGIGDGVAIPHGKLPLHPDMTVAFGRSVKGVEYDAMDGRPVSLFFLLITPEDRPGDHLKALARISRILKNPQLRERLRNAINRQELMTIISEEDSKYPQPSSGSLK